MTVWILEVRGFGYGVARFLGSGSGFPASGFRVRGFEVFEVIGFGFAVLRFCVSGSWFRDSGLGFGVLGLSKFGVPGFKFGVHGCGFEVSCFGVSRFGIFEV